MIPKLDVAGGRPSVVRGPALADIIRHVWPREAVQNERHTRTRRRRRIGRLVRHAVAIGTDGRDPGRIDAQHRRIEARHRGGEHLASLGADDRAGHRVERPVGPNQIAGWIQQIVAGAGRRHAFEVPQGKVQRHVGVSQRVIGHLVGDQPRVHCREIDQRRRRRLRIVTDRRDRHGLGGMVRRVVVQRHGDVEVPTGRRRKAHHHIGGIAGRHRQGHSRRGHREVAVARASEPDAADDQVRIAAVGHHHRPVRRCVPVHRAVI